MKRTYRTRRVLIVAALAVIGAAAGAQDLAEATFAGGCFWCMEKPFDDLEGVLSTTSGYSGGHVANPSYTQVTAGGTRHLEVVQVIYDPAMVTFEELLYVFWRNVDPTDGGGQFCDRGDSYRPAIFVSSEAERGLAERSAERVRRELGRRVQVDVLVFEVFYPAEDYHQDYYIRNPLRYAWYRSGCGRDRRLQEIWGDEAGGENAGMWL